AFLVASSPESLKSSFATLAASSGMRITSSGVSLSVDGMLVQLAVLMNCDPTPITKRTTKTLTPTRTALVVALSRIPMTRMIVTKMVMAAAGRLNQVMPCEVNGSEQRNAGTLHPKKTSRNLLKYFDQEAATQAQAMAYSRIKSQPMIQASNSPNV